MKKIISFFLSLVICTSFPFSAFAADTSNISSTLDSNFYLEADCLVKDGVVYLQRDQVLSNNGEITTHQVDSVSLVPSNGKTTADIVHTIDTYKANLKTRATITADPVWDSSVSVKTTTSINYASKTVDGVNYIKLTGFSGNYTIHDNHVSVTNVYVTYGTTGLGIGQYYTQNGEKIITSSSWSYSTPTGWEYVTTNANYFVGTTYTLSMSHMSGSTWTCTFSNNA